MRKDQSHTRTALRLEDVSKTFPGTRALDRVSLEAEHGKILALLGHNGSGKSTLVKILAGFHRPDPGSRGWIDGDEIDLGSSESALHHGLRFVHQDLGLIAELNAVDNVALTIGYSRSRSGQINQAHQIARTEELLARFGVELDVTQPLASASPVERTCVAIARALWDWKEGPRVLVLDEPTASLPSREVSRLLEVVGEVKAAGHSVLYVSHRMEEIFEIADELVVLRSGRVVGSGPISERSPSELATLIAGHELSEPLPRKQASRVTDSSDVALEISGLRSHFIDGVDIVLRRGEVLGVAGLVGSGRDELPYALAGAVPSTSSGDWRIAGKAVSRPSRTAAQAVGIAFVPAERGREGLVQGFTVGENLTLGSLPALAKPGFLSVKKERASAKAWLEEIGVPTNTQDDPVTTLSGGNQQRILLARCLLTNPSILVLAEPTAGVDVGARQSLYALLRERADDGLSIVLASSDTEDLTSLADRILVMRSGEVVCELTSSELNPTRIVSEMEKVS